MGNNLEGSSKLQMIGFLVNNDRDKVREKTPEKLAEFDRIVGRKDKKFSPTNFYDIKETISYHRVATRLIYGSETPENFYRMGQWDYKQIMGSQFGRIVKSLFVKDLKSGCLSFPKVFNSVIRGFRVESFDRGEKEVEITISSNVLYAPSYWKGFWQAHLQEYGVKGEVFVTDLPDKRRRIVIKWV